MAGPDEYEINLDIWKHVDVLRQGRNQTFLASNSATLIATGLIVAATNDPVVEGSAAVAAGVFGMSLCRIWSAVQVRHHAYIRFHRFKLRSLEESLTVSTFTEQLEAFEHGNDVVLGSRTFSLDEKERKSASAGEASLPGRFALLWGFSIVAGLATIAISLT